MWYTYAELLNKFDRLFKIAFSTIYYKKEWMLFFDLKKNRIFLFYMGIKVWEYN